MKKRIVPNIFFQWKGEIIIQGIEHIKIRLRLDWSVPEGSLCDAFFVNYTILTLTRPKSFSVATVDEFTVIKVSVYNVRPIFILNICVISA